MLNEKYSAPDGRGLQLAVPVPAGTKAGVPTLVGDMLVIPQSDQATADTIKAGTAPKSTKVGWAPCFLPGLGQLLDLGTMPDGIAVGKKVYRTAAGALVAVNGGSDLFVGYAAPAPGFNGGLFVAVRGNQ